jgi:predicted P-loop ATPase
LKQFVSRRIEIYRPPYGRGEVTEPRQCALIGTTNDAQYLKDETGARRFWPIKCGSINLEALKRDRDQIFAEAVRAYQGGARWWPDRDFERQTIKPQQDDRYAVDIWEPMVRLYLATCDSTTSAEIAVDCLGFALKDVKKADEMRISAILKRLKWTFRRIENRRVYFPPR